MSDSHDMKIEEFSIRTLNTRDALFASICSSRTQLGTNYLLEAIDKTIDTTLFNL